MGRVKDIFFRELGDQGADTWSRYAAQFEYTAYYCIRMLHAAEQIESVVPEGGDDVLVNRHQRDELHQIKTRDEGQGPWTTALVYPILCQQFSRRAHFRPACHFFFISNQIADNETKLVGNGLGSLYRLKELLDLQHEGQALVSKERSDWNALLPVVADKIAERMSSAHGESIDRSIAIDLLCRTHIETACPHLHYPNYLDDCCPKNLAELDATLAHCSAGVPAPPMFFLNQMYQQLLRLIYAKVRTSTTMEGRAVARDDVLGCRTVASPYHIELPALDTVPGRTILDKKAYLAGFKSPECQLMHRQLALAGYTRRRLIAEGREADYERLSMMLVDRQIQRWREVTGTNGDNETGPVILERLVPDFANIASTCFAADSRIDTQFCKGVLWNETNQCRAWWHAQPPKTGESAA